MRVNEKKTFRGKHLLRTYDLKSLKGSKVFKVEKLNAGMQKIEKVNICIEPMYQSIDFCIDGTWLEYRQEFVKQSDGNYGQNQSKSSITNDLWIWTSVNQFEKFFEDNLDTFLQA